MSGSLEAMPTPGPWSGGLGITPDHEGRWVIELGPDHLNFLDGAHGGAVFSLAETALVATAAADGAGPVLVDAHFAFTAGATEGDVLSAVVEPLNVGRTLGLYRVGVTRGDGRVAGVMTGTVWFDPVGR